MTRMTMTLALAAMSSLLLACGHGDECPAVDNPAIHSFMLEPATASAGDTVSATVHGEDLGFAAHSDGHGHDAEEGHEATCQGGHLHVYLDDLMTNPVVMTGEMTFDMTIPANITAGDHTLIVRLQNQDHTIFTPEVTAEATLTIQ